MLDDGATLKRFEYFSIKEKMQSKVSKRRQGGFLAGQSSWLARSIFNGTRPVAILFSLNASKKKNFVNFTMSRILA